jgi:hypothetical protein
MVYAELAQADPTGGTFAETLPCLKGQPCTGPTVGGIPSDIVRSSDGIHFCPSREGDLHGIIGGCPVYSSGAYRFAKAMVAPLATAVADSRAD